MILIMQPNNDEQSTDEKYGGEIEENHEIDRVSARRLFSGKAIS
jgi:hypothetical protein